MSWLPENSITRLAVDSSFGCLQLPVDSHESVPNQFACGGLKAFPGQNVSMRGWEI